MALTTEFDLGHCAKYTVAWARGIRASGSPSWRAAETQASVIVIAWGTARPMSSLATHKSLLVIDWRSPAFINLAK